MPSIARAGCAIIMMIASPWTMARSIPADDFARHADISEVTLSPGGDFIAMAVPVNGGMETQLRIIPLDSSGDVQVLRFGPQQHVSDITWSSDEQIVVSRAEMEPLHARPYSYGELMSTDVRGKHQQTLFAYLPTYGTTRGRRQDEGHATVVKILDREPGLALVEFTCWRSVCGEDASTVIYKVDTRTGHRREVERSDDPATFQFDLGGRARFKTTLDDADEPVISYRPGNDDAWLPLPTSLAGYQISAARFEDDSNLYALVSDGGEPAQLYKLDLASGTRTKVAGRDDADVSRIMYAGRDGIPFAVMHDSGKPWVTYLGAGSEWARLHADLMKRFPGQMVTISSSSRDNRKLLFSTWSDRNPGAYYLFDRDANKITLVSELMPWIKSEQLAATRPIEFTTRDGLKLFGFLTAPKGAEGPQPLVVMPHGGPHGPYDSWGYDSTVQFLANRGYSVLQVNFRGSGGRGTTFEALGHREWGGKMMDDIADGVQWVIENKFADARHICTFGASFGGYAALMNPIRYPDLYQCAVGYAGVYDLNVMRRKGDIPGQRSGRRYLDRVLGSDEAVLTANSPARNVDKIGVPVMLVQGRLDRRVPMAQFDALASAFANAGTPAETLVTSGEGHGFYKAENRAELFHRLEKFLDAHIGPGKAASAAAD